MMFASSLWVTFFALLQSACWQFMFSLFFLDKWQYRRPMPNRPKKYGNATELGEENRCLKHEMDMNTKFLFTRHVICMQQRERKYGLCHLYR